MRNNNCSKNWFFVFLLMSGLLLTTIEIGMAATGRSGGPDYYGYTFNDSDIVGGPVYNWIDIASTGTKIQYNLSHVDRIPIGFNFNFYGTYNSQVCIAYNGIISFNANGNDIRWMNESIGLSNPHNFIAPFWSDLGTSYLPSAGDAVYYQTIGKAPNRKFIVMWNKVYPRTGINTSIDYLSAEGATFEAILNEGSNSILFQYKNVTFSPYFAQNVGGAMDYGGEATVGIEGPIGQGLQYSYDEKVLESGKAILFKYPQQGGTNFYISNEGPQSSDQGSSVTYTLYYNNIGIDAQNVVLEDTLPDQVVFESASDNGVYDSSTRTVRWDIGSVNAAGDGYRTLNIRIPAETLYGTTLLNSANISTSNLKFQANAQTVVTGTNLFLSLDAPESEYNNHSMAYTLYYNNYGTANAQNVVLEDRLPDNVVFESASDNGVYDSSTRTVRWDLGSVDVAGNGYKTLNVSIPPDVPVGTVIQDNAYISTSNFVESQANAQTLIVTSPLPPNVGIEGAIPTAGGTGTPSVYWGSPVTFTYHSCQSASAVDIKININDGGPDIIGNMAGGSSDWTYTTTFYPRHGIATVTYTVHGCSDETVNFNIYIDPAGYIYDIDTGQRIAGATVWLQYPDSTGGWKNVPTGQRTMDPDTNPLTTDVNGMYQWNVLAGSYRVHVEAPGYEPKNSIVVTVPPPVTDLNVGLTHITPPIINEINSPVDPLKVGAPVTVKSTFTDTGILDTHTAVWDWGDGFVSSGSITENGGAGTVSGTHTYSSAGVYKVKLTVTDDSSESGYSVSNCVVIYDPEGGFVTGGGWINSPKGAYASDTSLTGIANFGFVSKYKKGANVPTGTTEFNFQLANLNFHSDSYEWLVISGARAQYKGTGTINGKGDYSFMLTAIDGELNGGGGTDKFRIKIWDKTSGNIIYDNMMGAADTADPTTILQKGSITIHKEK